MAFDANSTTDQVLHGIDLSGRHFVITGAASGLGEEATRALAARGATVLMLARDPEKNAAAADRIRASVPDADLRFGDLDLADLASVRACARRILDADEPIDVLMNNAGVMACPFGRTADGFETQFGTNHLGHFELTRLLEPAIVAGDAPRIVNLSSAAHGISDVDLDDPNYERRPYGAWEAYGRSKSANAHHARSLARRLGGSGVLAFSVHPGGIMTNLGRHLDEQLLQELMDRSAERGAKAGDDSPGIRFKSVEQGAATQVWAATAPELAAHSGAYLADCTVGVAGGNVGTNGYEPYIDDDETADRLWELSESLVG